MASMSWRPAVLFIVLLAAALLAPARGAGDHPEATDWGPQGDNVGLYGPILITWTDRMDDASVEAAFRLADNVTVWGASSFQWIHATAPPWTSRASPLVPLPPSTNFTATVLPTATDAPGRALDQNRNGVGGEPDDNLTWTFRTEDGVPPRVVATSPPDGATDVPVSTDIAIVFDEPMDTDSVEAALVLDPPTEGTVRWDANRIAMAFAPDLYLFPGTLYAVTLSEDARDANGAPTEEAYAFNFTTRPDVEPPRVLSVDPPPGAQNVSVAARITVRFSEAMNRTRVEGAMSYENGTQTWNGTAGVFAWTGETYPDDTVTFNPDENLPFAATVTVAINGSEARDRSGDLLDGDGNGIGGDDLTWSFATEAMDRDPPRVTATDPADADSEVRETTAIRIAFSERMNGTTVEDAFLLQDPVRTWTKADGWFSWVRGYEDVTFTPSTNLAYESEYVLSIRQDAMDANGNRIDGDGSGGNFTARFRTRPQPDTVPPHVLATIPAPGQGNVSRASRITITFDDGMDRDRTEAAIGLAAITPIEPTPVPVGDFVWAAGDHAVSFRRLGGPLDWATEYEVTVGGTAADDGGNALEGGHSFRFSTEVWTGRVTGHVVAAGQPLAGAKIRIGEQTTVSGGNGTFEFPAVRAGTYELAVSMPGYQTLQRTVTLDHRAASADFSAIDLGEFSLVPEESPILAVVAAFGATVTALLALGWYLRRRRGPPEEHLEDWDEETAEALR